MIGSYNAVHDYKTIDTLGRKDIISPSTKIFINPSLPIEFAIPKKKRNKKQ